MRAKGKSENAGRGLGVAGHLSEIDHPQSSFDASVCPLPQAGRLPPLSGGSDWRAPAEAIAWAWGCQSRKSPKVGTTKARPGWPSGRLVRSRSQAVGAHRGRWGEFTVSLDILPRGVLADRTEPVPPRNAREGRPPCRPLSAAYAAHALHAVGTSG